MVSTCGLQLSFERQWGKSPGTSPAFLKGRSRHPGQFRATRQDHFWKVVLESLMHGPQRQAPWIHQSRCVSLDLRCVSSLLRLCEDRSSFSVQRERQRYAGPSSKMGRNCTWKFIAPRRSQLALPFGAANIWVVTKTLHSFHCNIAQGASQLSHEPILKTSGMIAVATWQPHGLRSHSHVLQADGTTFHLRRGCGIQTMVTPWHPDFHTASCSYLVSIIPFYVVV